MHGAVLLSPLRMYGRPGSLDWTIRKTKQIAINPFGSLLRYILGLFWSDLHDVVSAI